MVARASDAKAILGRLRPPVEEELRTVIGLRPEVSSLYRLMQYHMRWLDYDKDTGEFTVSTASGGKRFRPIMCLLTTSALEGDMDTAIPAGASLELIHNFSLIFDDIQDNDELRRFRPSIWAVIGKPRALNIGAGMHSLVNVASLRLRDKGVPADTILDIMDVLSQSIIELFEGQEMDLSFEERDDVAVEEYITMVGKKTAALVEASCATGAILATNDKGKVDLLATFGRSIGIAFQIQDDVLGIWKDPKKMGTPLGSDIRNHKKSLPIIYALNNASKKDRKLVLVAYHKEQMSDEDVKAVMDVLERCGAREYAESVAEEYAKKGMAALDTAGLSDDAELRTIARFLIHREF